MSRTLCHIELNEVNFDIINEYLDYYPVSRWKNIRKLTDLKRVETWAEDEYENLEPWIQWTSIHTGKSAGEHKVFRLGDINNFQGEQIFEYLERNGVTIGCISPMNATNKLKNPEYFIPDPWTLSETDGSFWSKKIHSALKQAVNDNSSGKLTKETLFYLLLALVLKSQPSNWLFYLKSAHKALMKKRWHKALFLDLFISDLHLNCFNRKRPRYTTVFFNAFAHIQHHYFFNSQFYNGAYKNPDWYIEKSSDPFIDALDVYDRIIGDHLKCFKEAEILLSTGLSQVPFTKQQFYYRLASHSEFLSLAGIENYVVHPRMTRDFLIEFESQEDCLNALNKLSTIHIQSVPVFGKIDNRGKSLFVTLTYPEALTPGSIITIDDDNSIDADKHFVFVAIKNGMHHSKGFCFSTMGSNEFDKLNGSHVKHLFSYVIDRVCP